MMGGEAARLHWRVKAAHGYHDVRLWQGAVKTDGKAWRKPPKTMNKRPLWLPVTCRPAAVKQLEVLGEQIQVPRIFDGTDESPVRLPKRQSKHAVKHGNDPVITDAQDVCI